MVPSVISGFASLIVASSLALGQRLDKPPLHPNLDYLEQGMVDNLHPMLTTLDKWVAGWIADDCKKMTVLAGLNPADIETWHVHYADCGDPWIVCRHKDSPSPFENLVDFFGRLPVGMRQWVRHLIALPNPKGGHAYNWGGNIAMFNMIDNMDLFVHEAGHSLDLLGAYPFNPLSTSDNWISNYNQDSAVPDPYAQSNQIENVAQNTVIAVYNVIVNGGFGAVEPNWGNIFHQYATIQTQAGRMIYPGGTCTHRLTNSAPVQQTTPSRIKPLSKMPDVSLSSNVTIIPPKEFYTGDSCYPATQKVEKPAVKKPKTETEKPDVSLSINVEIIAPNEFFTADH